MLVLGRCSHQSVVLADEITLTVEEICDNDGRCIFGATVRLGFESPRYVSVCRSELCAKRSGTAHANGSPKPRKTEKTTRPRTGKLVKISDAQVRLRIQVPRKIPVRCNGTPMVAIDSEERLDGETHTSKAVHHVTCHKDDRITICNNITVATLDFRRFVSSGNP